MKQDPALQQRLMTICNGLLAHEVESGGFATVMKSVIEARKNDHAIFFIGNGGSAAIASHMAADWLKNGRFLAYSFNDPALLTCISNDLGYTQVFAHPIGRIGRAGCIVFAISSSGNSVNIHNAAKIAREREMGVITLSGMSMDNHLRAIGHVNFYVPSYSYRVIEVSHLAILHAILDEAMNVE